MVEVGNHGNKRVAGVPVTVASDHLSGEEVWSPETILYGEFKKLVLFSKDEDD